jgi:hypothetical protein
MGYKTFAVCVQGESHKKHNRPLLDSTTALGGGDLCIVAVADGHGSDNCFRGDEGSSFATYCTARGAIGEFFKGIRETEADRASKGDAPLSEKELAGRLKNQLVPGIVRSWNIKVDAHCREYPLTEDDSISGSLRDALSGPVSRNAYGATLIAAVITRDYWFGIQIGDGKLTAFYPDGSYDQPVPWDERCSRDTTTLICDEDAAASARVYVQRKGDKPLPAAILINSDGVDDSFAVEDNMNQMIKGFCFPVLSIFLKNGPDDRGWSESKWELRRFLSAMSRDGSGDDMAVVGIIDLEAIAAALSNT